MSLHPEARENDGLEVQADHSVLILDDDRSILTSLYRLLRGRGYHVETYSNVSDLLRAGEPRTPACLLLDNQLNDSMSGVEVHAEMLRRGWDVPTVFLTAHWNVRSIVNAMRAGADGFLTKPFDPEELIEAVELALDHARARHAESRRNAKLLDLASTLTSREMEIVRLVAGGMLNKEIASQLGIALVTVKIHRGRAMQKLGAGNAAELALIATKSGIVS